MAERYLIDADAEHVPVIVDVAVPPEPMAVAVLAVRERRNPLAMRIAAALFHTGFATITAALLTNDEQPREGTPAPTLRCGHRLSRVVEAVRTDRRFVQLPIVLVDIDTAGAALVAATLAPAIAAVASWAAPSISFDVASLLAPVVIIVDDADVDGMRRARRALALATATNGRIVVVSRRNAADVEALIHATTGWLRQRVVVSDEVGLSPPA